MAVFVRLLYAAVCAGLLSGGLMATAHQIGTVPLILQAEVYERAAHGYDAAPAETEWKPENGLQRALYTAAADLLTGIGFALLLAAGLALRGGEIGWRDGLFWGLGGFAAFTLAPALGLPPELPGSEAAPLLARQLWWLWAAMSTAAGLGLLAFTRRPWLAVAAAALLALPQAWGPPLPPNWAAAAPPDIAHRFIASVILVSFLFWASLGASTGYFYRRFAALS